VPEQGIGLADLSTALAVLAVHLDDMKHGSGEAALD